MARKCILCGKEYAYCPSCPKDAKKESWYTIFDNENCKNISKALTDYNLNKISKVEVSVTSKQSSSSKNVWVKAVFTPCT